MAYFRIDDQWRQRATGVERPPAISPDYHDAADRYALPDFEEPTESRSGLSATQRDDSESTEKIRKRRAAESHVRRALKRRQKVSRQAGIVPERKSRNETAAPPEVTHPIASRQAARSELRIDVSESGDDPSALPDFVIQPASRRTSVKPGDLLAGRYVVSGRVEHSGMGVVFKALDRHRQHAGSPMPWVALKFSRSIDGEAGGDEETAHCLRQEYLKLERLSHANIVSVYDFDSDGGLDFIVMEWLEGETLGSLLSTIGKRPDPALAREIVIGLATAVGYAHERGIVHGDIKPSNVFLTVNRRVKLLDFGSSETRADDGDAVYNWATRAYASGAVLRGDTPQKCDDVYSLGVTAYCVLSGERPFGSFDANEAEKRNQNPSPLPADVARYWPAVEEALHFDPRERPCDACAFLHEFTASSSAGGIASDHGRIERTTYGAIAVALIVALIVWATSSIGELTQGTEAALDRADDALAAGRLLEPQDESAYTHYSNALELSPGNDAAERGLDRVADALLSRARDALVANDPESAMDLLASARDVAPDHFGIPIVDDLVTDYGMDLLAQASDAARDDVAGADALLQQASRILPDESQAVERSRERIETLREAQKVDSLLAGIHERVLSERLIVPNGDSAVDLLRRARRLAPDDPQVVQAADRITSALVFQSLFAVSNGSLDLAETYINAAKALDVRHLALARAQYELAKARHAAVRDGGGNEGA